MALARRILSVTLSMPGGDVVLSENIFLQVRVMKAALAIQNRATIEIIGLTTSLREQLISQFTAWNQRQVDIGLASQNYINVAITAGYNVNGVINSAVIFRGQVVTAEPSSPPPNIGVRIVCFSRQIDKTSFVSVTAPAETTFYNYVAWAAGQMGFGKNFVCDTSYNDQIIYNPSRSRYVASALLIDIQNVYRPDVAAFVDDDVLIVKDRNKIVNPAEISNIETFIGAPGWTEWGVKFTTMFDHTIKLAQAVQLKSVMNPGVNNKYVVTELEYDLASRNGPFYVTGSASPPA